jgi:hypothetical protein
MVSTDMFVEFARRMAATQGCPYIAIAQTPNPLRQLQPEAVRARAEDMMSDILDGLTLPAPELESRLRAQAASRGAAKAPPVRS